MNFNLHLTNNDHLELSLAVLCYKGQRHQVMTVHEVETRESGAPKILPGRPITSNELRSMLEDLASQAASSGYIPHNLLCKGLDSMIWFTPPSIRPVFFNEPNGIGLRSGNCPLPGLVFKLSGSGLSIYAVRGNSRPEPSTPLFYAPFYNTYENGSVCMGSAAIPNYVDPRYIPECENAFFNSEFTHSNYHGKEKVLRYKGCLKGLWKELLDGKYPDVFPDRALCKTKYTLNDLIDD
jgi:PRTRC genetic system protein B